MGDLEEVPERLGDAHRRIVRRKRANAGRGIAVTPREPQRRPGPEPDGVMWPTGGFEADQYSPAGEVLVFSRFLQALKRRWG